MPKKIHNNVPVTRKGPKGIAVIHFLFVKRIRKIPKNAPSNEPITRTAKHDRDFRPNIAPNAAINLISPKPRTSFFEITFPIYANKINMKPGTIIPRTAFGKL